MEVSPTNFFNMNSTINKINNDLDNSLRNKASRIYLIRGWKKNTEEYIYIDYIACRLFLEKFLSELEIEDFYHQINENNFIILKLDNFKEILSSNFIFDKDDFINKLNLSIYNINKEILSDFLEEKEKYRELLEQRIKDFYSKDIIIKEIDYHYKSEINKIDDDIANNIKIYIQNILNSIKNH